MCLTHWPFLPFPPAPLLRQASGLRDWFTFHVCQCCVGGTQTIHSCSCAPRQTKIGADSSTAATASTLLPEDVCSQSLRFTAVVQSLVNWAWTLPLHPWNYPEYCLFRRFCFCFQKHHSLRVVKSAVLTAFFFFFQETHSIVHLDSWQSRPVPVRGPERRWGEVSARKARARTRGRQDESQESFDFHPLHYLWDSF